MEPQLKKNVYMYHVSIVRLPCLLVEGLSRDDRHMVVARTRGPGDAGIDWLPGELPCCPDPQERWPRGPTQKSQTTEIFALAAV